MPNDDLHLNEGIVEILIRRDGMTAEEANAALEDAREQVAQGADPEQVLADEFGLEPDYFWELI
jgi:hypothetical protein